MAKNTIRYVPAVVDRPHRRPQRNRSILAAALAVGLSVTAAVPAFGATRPRRVNITAANITFAPTTIALKKGQKVTFALNNTDKIKHNLTIKDLKVNADVNPGKTGTATLTLKVPGTYEFHCEYHPQKMKGTITVT